MCSRGNALRDAFLTGKRWFGKYVPGRITATRPNTPSTGGSQPMLPASNSSPSTHQYNKNNILVYRNINIFTFILFSFTVVVVDRYTDATMSRKAKKPVLVLDAAQTGKLTSLAGSRTAPARDVARAQMLLSYAAGQSLARSGSRIQRSTNASKGSLIWGLMPPCVMCHGRSASRRFRTPAELGL